MLLEADKKCLKTQLLEKPCWGEAGSEWQKRHDKPGLCCEIRFFFFTGYLSALAHFFPKSRLASLCGPQSLIISPILPSSPPWADAPLQLQKWERGEAVPHCEPSKATCKEFGFQFTKINDHYKLFKGHLNIPTKEKESILRTSSFCALGVGGSKWRAVGSAWSVVFPTWEE